MVKRSKTEISKAWKKQRADNAPRIEALCIKPHFMTDEEIGLKLGLSMSHVFNVRKDFGIVSGKHQREADTRKRAKELWDTQQDWLWCRGRLGASDSGFKKVMLELHDKGLIVLPEHLLKKKPRGMFLPVMNAQHMENSQKKAKFGQASRRKVPEYWERLTATTPDWIVWTKNAKGRRIATVMP